MRRGGVLFAIVGLLLAVVPVALAGDGSDANYKDRFNEVSYAGSDGTIHWAEPWQEVGDDGSPSAGSVGVDSDSSCSQGRCLHISGELLTLDEVGAFRLADTSMFVTAEVSYHLGAALIEADPLTEITSDQLQLDTARLTVEVTKNRGGDWTVIDQWSVLHLLDQSKVKVKPIDAYLSDGFGIRFLVDGLIGGRVLIDDVEIRGKLAGSPTTSTTTTTKPSTTSTTAPQTTTSTSVPRQPDREDSTTSTTVPLTTTSTERTSQVVEPTGGDPPPNDGSFPGSGAMRHAEHGLQAGYDMGRFGNPDMPRPEVLGLSIDYRMAAEVVSSSWLGLVALVLLITAALVHGLDRRTTGDPG